MDELTPWPYAPLASIYDVNTNGFRRVVQKTEDGMYGFAFVGDRQVASMIGPYAEASDCLRELRKYLK